MVCSYRSGNGCIHLAEIYGSIKFLWGYPIDHAVIAPIVLKQKRRN